MENFAAQMSTTYVLTKHLRLFRFVKPMNVRVQLSIILSVEIESLAKHFKCFFDWFGWVLWYIIGLYTPII